MHLIIRFFFALNQDSKAKTKQNTMGSLGIHITLAYDKTTHKLIDFGCRQWLLIVFVITIAGVGQKLFLKTNDAQRPRVPLEGGRFPLSCRVMTCPIPLTVKLKLCRLIDEGAEYKCSAPSVLIQCIVDQSVINMQATTCEKKIRTYMEKDTF